MAGNNLKRYGFIYEKICDPENIRNAILHAAKGKKDRRTVEEILENVDLAVEILEEILIDKTFKPSPYKEIIIKDGASQKERVIYKPKFFPDQCVHWCLMLQLEPIIMKSMYAHTCGSIPGRGIHHGKKHLRKWLDHDIKHTKYCLKLDIKKFYPSVDTEVLKTMFRKKIKDKDALWLIDIIVDSHKQGLPIGNYTSQWFSNFFLCDLDYYIKQELGIKYYMRYMDDMVLLGNNKKKLHKAKKAIDAYLDSVHLQLKENWQVFKVDKRPIDVLGFKFYRDRTTLRKRNALRIKRRVKKAYNKPVLDKQDAAALISYYGWLKHSDSYLYYQKHFKPYFKIKQLKEVISNESRKQC